MIRLVMIFMAGPVLFLIGSSIISYVVKNAHSQIFTDNDRELIQKMEKDAPEIIEGILRESDGRLITIGIKHILSQKSSDIFFYENFKEVFWMQGSCKILIDISRNTKRNTKNREYCDVYFNAHTGWMFGYVDKQDFNPIKFKLLCEDINEWFGNFEFWHPERNINWNVSILSKGKSFKEQKPIDTCEMPKNQLHKLQPPKAETAIIGFNVLGAMSSHAIYFNRRMKHPMHVQRIPDSDTPFTR